VVRTVSTALRGQEQCRGGAGNTGRKEAGPARDSLADCHHPTQSGMSRTFYLLQENNKKLSSGPIHIISEFYCCPSLCSTTVSPESPDRIALCDGWRMASRDQRTNIFCNAMECVFVVRSRVDVLIIFLAEMLIHSLFSLELVGKSELGSLLLQLGKLVLVLGDLLEGRLDELALHVTDGDGELVDLKVSKDDFALEEKHLSLELVPLVKVPLADLLEVIYGGIVDVSLGAAPLSNDTEPLLSLALLLLLQLLGGLLTEKSPELLLPLGCHESLLLGHDGVCPWS